MTLFSALFGKKERSASQATERLKMVLAHERAENALPFMDEMKQELIAVIKKYTQVKDISITADKNENIDVLEVEIVLDR